MDVVCVWYDVVPCNWKLLHFMVKCEQSCIYLHLPLFCLCVRNAHIFNLCMLNAPKLVKVINQFKIYIHEKTTATMFLRVCL